jgi:hypothetical protein
LFIATGFLTSRPPGKRQRRQYVRTPCGGFKAPLVPS